MIAISAGYAVSMEVARPSVVCSQEQDYKVALPFLRIERMDVFDGHVNECLDEDK